LRLLGAENLPLVVDLLEDRALIPTDPFDLARVRARVLEMSSTLSLKVTSGA
jgi:ribosomal protein L14E/L6E/L27E